jgi:hypothetical protein
LIDEYLHLKKGELIADFLELIFVCKLNDRDVCISKRSLKHFVESRSGELLEYNNEYILERLYFIIDNIKNVLHNSDFYKVIEKRFYYTKDFFYPIRPSIRIVLESINDHFEIVTMHYKKTKNTTQKE